MEIHYRTVEVIDLPRTSQEIRLTRNKYKLTQEQLAKAVGVSRTFIAQIEAMQRDLSVGLAGRIKGYFDSLDQTSSRTTTGSILPTEVSKQSYTQDPLQQRTED